MSQIRKEAVKESSQGFLMFIEPEESASSEPVIDELTRKAAAALRSAALENGGRGTHECSCGAKSDCDDHWIGDDPRSPENLERAEIGLRPNHNGVVTNSLLVHYLAWHREEVPAEEIEKLIALFTRLSLEEVEPDEEELAAPTRKR